MMNRLKVEIRKLLMKADLWREDAVFLAGVSGGGDSVALLYGLKLLRQEMPFQLICCHVQHNLRGEDSLADQRFVEDLCREWNISCSVADAGLKGNMHSPGMESLARDKRRELFASWMETFSADAVFLAHHRDDQTETALMHLFRGSGLKGLTGMLPMQSFGRGYILRPLLHMGKMELEQILSDAGIPFCHDTSNDEIINPRNTLRLRILPELEKLYPGVSQRIGEACGSFLQDEECLSSFADRLFVESFRAGQGFLMLKTAPLLASFDAIVIRVLRKFYREGLRSMNVSAPERDLSREDTLKLFSLLQGAPGQTANLPNDMEICRGNGYLFLSRQGGGNLFSCKQPSSIVLCPGTNCFDRFLFHLETAPEDWSPSASSVLLFPEEITGLEIRFPREGDRIHPLGAPGSKLLRRWLTDQKIDALLRPYIPVLARGSHILWVPGICCDESLRRFSSAGCLQLSIENTEECIYLHKE